MPTRDCLRILDRLREDGAPVESVVYPGAIHGLVGVDFWPDVDPFLARAGRPDLR